MAKKYNGEFLLRIEDIDQARSKTVYIDQIFDDLSWLGLSWPEPILFQSTRAQEYQKALNILKSKDLIYESALTRQDIRNIDPDRKKDPDGVPLIMRKDEPQRAKRSNDIAWRLKMEKALESLNESASFSEYDSGPKGEKGYQTLEPDIWGNVMLARKDIHTSYHLSVVVDDAWQNVTHVTRGQDLFYSTHIHVLLQKLLGLPTPKYFHHPLINDKEGQKLSKSAGHTSLKNLRKEGVTRDEIFEFLSIRAT